MAVSRTHVSPQHKSMLFSFVINADVTVAPSPPHAIARHSVMRQPGACYQSGAGRTLSAIALDPSGESNICTVRVMTMQQPPGVRSRCQQTTHGKQQTRRSGWVGVRCRARAESSSPSAARCFEDEQPATSNQQPATPLHFAPPIFHLGTAQEGGFQDFRLRISGLRSRIWI